jgi:hypothetical protein
MAKCSSRSVWMNLLSLCSHVDKSQFPHSQDLQHSSILTSELNTPILQTGLYGFCGFLGGEDLHCSLVAYN